MKTTHLLLISIIGLFVLSGCSAKGKAFRGFKHPTANRGLLYVYRPDRFTGSVVHYSIKDKQRDQTIGTLYNNSYFVRNVPVGTYILASPTSSTEINIQAQKITCLKSYIEIVSMITGYSLMHLKEVPYAQCKHEIRGTKESL